MLYSNHHIISYTIPKYGGRHMDILDKIRLLCDERNWSVYMLAQKSGVPQTTIRNMFKRNTLPHITTLESICNGFGMTMSQFLAKKGEPIPINEEQREVLELWGAISEDEKKAIILILKNLANEKSKIQ